MKNITVIGAGSWGTALACLLAQNNHEVTLWSYTEQLATDINKNKENIVFLPNIKIPNSITVTNDISLATTNKKIYILAVPSIFVRETMQTFKPFLKKDDLIINVAKGLDEVKQIRLSEVIEEVVPECKVAVLSGPSHAEEVAKKIPTTVVVSAKDENVYKLAQDIFMNEYFRVYTNNDLIGIELGGALKNVIALASGVSDGLGFGDNTKSAIMTRGIAEISRLGVAMGGNPMTFNGLAGVGDLIVTCTSMHSRNRRAGILLGQGKQLEDVLKEVGMVVEGVNTAKSALLFALKYNVDMPIIQQINKILFEQKDPKEAVYDLMKREKTTENEF
jgi:glycerol-3-phosphate dehydrogenase (NAD(P)+)